MPRLPRLFTALVTDHPLPLTGEHAEPLQELSAPDLERVVAASQELLGEGVGHGLVDGGVDAAAFTGAVTRASVEADGGLGQVRREGRTLGPGEADEHLVTAVQRLLQAGSRTPDAPKAMALPQWGADGDYGNETLAAVRSLQRHVGMEPADGIFDTAVLEAATTLLDAAGTPDLFPPLPSELPEAAGARIVAVANGLCEASAESPFRLHIDGRTYAYAADDFAVDPPRDGSLHGPGGVRYSLGPNRSYWKCNVFGGIVLSLSELNVPTHWVGSIRHYPRAERFGDRLAQKRGWRLVQHLDHRDPNNRYEPLVGDEQDEQIHSLMQAMEPGDLFFVDHLGEPAEDGGHTRVCVRAAAAGEEDPTPQFAQAKREGALVKGDAYSTLKGGKELQFWVVRHG